MLVHGFWGVFLCGAFGGLAGELLKWYRLRELHALPRYARSPFYWMVTALMVVAGGILASLYGLKEVNALMAVNIGVSAPLIVQSLSRTIPAFERGTSKTEDLLAAQKTTSILEFLRA